MKSSEHQWYNSISELHETLKLAKPTHPLVSVVKLDDIDIDEGQVVKTIGYNFYSVFIKRNFDGKIKYGRQYYDFDDGTMTFYAPKQLVTVEDYTPSKMNGWMLVFHTDLLFGYPLAKTIKDYGFFSYAANEALHLSDKEDDIISGIMQNLKDEIENMIDGYTQGVIIAHIDLLLNYCSRFYNRQFITRKKVSSDLLVSFEELLMAYYNDDDDVIKLPTVQYFADKLYLSPNYLSDMLKSLTGMSTQQHIHNYLIEKAKELLSSTELSVSEIAYQLGFEYPQSFNKLFKNKTEMSPLAFRESFN